MIEENHVFINVNICKKLHVRLDLFCRILADFVQGKNYALFRNNRIQRNIRKPNEFFGYYNSISFDFGLKTSFEMSERQLNVLVFSGRQIISYNKGVVLVNLLSIRWNCLYYVSNLPL